LLGFGRVVVHGLSRYDSTTAAISSQSFSFGSATKGLPLCVVLPASEAHESGTRNALS
jgi:hypothetical protein